MKNILIHGLGQNSKDWDTIKNELETRGIGRLSSQVQHFLDKNSRGER